MSHRRGGHGGKGASRGFAGSERGSGSQANRGRGGRGGGGPVTSETFKIGFMKLKEKSNINTSPRDASMFCLSPAFCKLLAGEQNLDEKPDWIDMMLSIIHKAFSVDRSMRECKDNLVIELMKDTQVHFLTKICVDRFTEGLESAEGIPIDGLVNSLSHYLDIYFEVCSLNPFAHKTLLKKLKNLSMVLRCKVYEDEMEELKGICDKYAEAVAKANKKEKAMKEEKEKAANEKKAGRMFSEEKPTDDFREIPIYPVAADLDSVAKIRRNKKTGAFDSNDDYLDIQFRLLREDFISTLRNGIKDYRCRDVKSGRKFKSQDVKVFEGFYIIQPNLGQDGMTYSLQLDKNLRMFKRKNFDSGKNFIYGSLLCLSLDGFHTNILFAAIAERDNKKLEQDRTVEIQFIPTSQEEYDGMVNKYGPFTVAESSAYYESYMHILAGMQNVNKDHLAMSRYIVSCEKEILPPAYLAQTSTQYYTVEDAEGEDICIRLDDEAASQRSYFELNDSQWDAYITALTSEFSVIQGPPGTGKTYVGLRIVKTLLDNLYSPLSRLGDDHYPNAGSKLNKPTLVVCYTNHALDQFLEGILNFCDEKHVIRVGSRSNNEALEKCNLKQQRYKYRRDVSVHISYKDLQANKEKFQKENNLSYLQQLIATSEGNIVDHMAYYNDYMFIGQEILYDQLDYYGHAIAQSGYSQSDAMRVWLGCDDPTTLYASNANQGTDATIEEPQAPALIDMEGDSTREMQHRQLDTADVEDAEFLAQIRGQGDGALQQQGSGGQSSQGSKPVVSEQLNEMLLSGTRKKLWNGDMMSEQEVNDLVQRCIYQRFDITYHLNHHHRWRLYRYWLKKYRQVLSTEVRRVQQDYQKLCQMMHSLRRQEDIDVLRHAKVIGMTTTGAAKYQDVLQQVQPPIVVVEEAAEVLEAHITTALSEHCQQLILIGDHKQLKPNPTVYELAKKYNLDLSLFERMVNNGLPVRTLNIQHRMRPEVSKYIRGHVYDRLDDHPSVCDRVPIKGLSKSVYFFNHRHEEKSEEGLMSHSNEFEANMIVALTRYLILQNYEPEDITIITMYTGQLLMLRKKMPKDQFEGVRITSVDNFQGEENEIVIVSLVRSNAEGKLGFVKVENRICVALSRAKYGMYVFGDFDMFTKGSELWSKIVKDATAAEEIGSSISLACVNHGHVAYVTHPEEFQTKAPAGGCKKTCAEKLDCGHFCERSCHINDPDHSEYQCQEKCTRVYEDCGHPCRERCWQECPPCRVPKQLVLRCGHELSGYCYQDEEKEDCVEKCPLPLPCGHNCKKRCSQPCTSPCTVNVSRECSHCGEIKDVPCHIAMADDSHYRREFDKCDTPCEEILSCGHHCPGNCYRCRGGHASCDKPCNKKLACGHICDKKCAVCVMMGTCNPCTQECLLTCSHAQNCTRKCNESCLFHVHNNKVKCKWGCKKEGHGKCERKCEEPCSHKPCDVPCDRVVRCRKCRRNKPTEIGEEDGYRCRGVCGEPCPFMCPDCDEKKAEAEAIRYLGVQVSDSTMWLFLRDCLCMVPADFMDKYVKTRYKNRQGIVCPYPHCQRPLLNTSRYVSMTRFQQHLLLEGSSSDNEDFLDQFEEEMKSLSEKVETQLRTPLARRPQPDIDEDFPPLDY